jgi:hypothetical protein
MPDSAAFAVSTGNAADASTSACCLDFFRRWHLAVLWVLR